MNFEQAKLNPAASFKSPDDVVLNADLTSQQKIEILKRWEEDARAIEVAEEEGMASSQPKLLQPIRDALHKLGYWPNPEHFSPTKA